MSVLVAMIMAAVTATVVVMITIVPVVMAMAIGMAVPVSVIIFVPMPMPMPMPMLVLVLVLVTMRVFVPVTLREYLLRERVVFGERGIVPMTMPSAVGARFGMKRQRFARDARTQARQHRLEHGVCLELQIVDADLHRRVPIAEMVGRTRERQRVGGAHHEHGFGRGDHAHERTVVGDEHVAIGQHGAAWHDERDFFARIERGGEAALATRVVSERECGRAGYERGGEFRGRGNTFIDRAHREMIGALMCVRK